MAAWWKGCFAGACFAFVVLILHLSMTGVPRPSHPPAVAAPVAQQRGRGGNLSSGGPRNHNAVAVAQQNRGGLLDADPNFQVLEERKNSVLQRCAEREEDPIPIDEVVMKILERQVPLILVNDKYKVLYCKIHKCSSTSMGKFFVMLATNKSKDTAHISTHDIRKHIDVTWLHDLSSAEIKQRLLTYTKLVVVREPLERVISGYRTGKKVSNNATFPDFVDWLNAQTRMRNLHYMFYTQRCLPCSIRYDLILDVNTLPQDMETTKAILHIEKNFVFSKRKITGYTKSQSKEVYETYLRQLNATQLETFWKVNRDDYTLFGYENPTTRGNRPEGSNYKWS